MKEKSIVALMLIVMLSIVLIGCATNIEQTDGNIEFHSNFEEDVVSFDSNTSFEREGYTFIGWSYEKDGDIISGDIDKNSTVYAQWKINTYTVKFYVGINLISESTIDYLGSATAPTSEQINPYLDGKEFVSWDKSFECIKSNLTINAILQEATIKHLVAFKDNRGIIKEFNLAEGQTINESLIPQIEKDGFTFEKWIDEEGTELTDSYIVTKSSSFSPIFSLDTPINPTIVSDKTAYTYGDSISINATNNYEYENIKYSYSWSSKYDKDELNQSNFENNLAFSSTPKYVGKITYFLTTTAEYQEEIKTNTSFIIVNIDKANLNVSILNDLNLSFGDSLPLSYELLVEGYKFDDNYSSLNGEIQFTTNYSNTSRPANYDIQMSGLSSSYYNIIYTTKVFSVSKKTIEIANNLEKTYDTKTIASSYASSLENGAQISCSYETASSNVGEYSYTNNNLNIVFTAYIDELNVSDCFDITYSIFAKINPATIEYTLPEETTFNYTNSSYGAVVATQTGGCSIEYSLDNADFTKYKIEKINAGEYTIYYKISKENYNTIYGSFTLTINKADIYFSIDDKEITYGDTIPSFTCTTSGESYGTLFDYSYKCDYIQGSDIGEYEIDMSFNEDYSNFNCHVTKSKLNVIKRKLDIVINNLEVEYGNALPEVTFTANIYDKDNSSDILNITTNYAVGDDVDTTRKISADIISQNYERNTLSEGTITILPRDISISAIDKEVEYGNAFDISNYQYVITSGSLFDGDTISASYSCDYVQSNYSSAGSSFPILISAIITRDESNISKNYNISYNKGSLKVIKRNISIYINDRNVIYGSQITLVDCTYCIVDGSASIVNDDNLSMSYSCTYSQGDPTGSYDITAESGNKNYNVLVTPGALIVGKKAISIVIDETKAQNGEVYTKTFVNYITSNIISGDTINGTISTKSIEDGEYTSNDSFDFNIEILNSDNESRTDSYDISYNIHVLIATLKIGLTASGVNCEYDATYHTGNIDITETGLENETIYYSSDQESFTQTIPQYKDAGEYTIYYRVTADNKTPTEGSFIISIRQIEITITATSQTIYYGDDNSTLTYSITSGAFIAGEETLLEVNLSCDYNQGNSVGIYSITIKTNDLTNYAITPISASITVQERVINIEVSNNSLTYGETYSQPKYTATNLYNDDTSFISISVENYVSLLSVGTYKYIAITTNSNYTLNINEAYLTIQKRVASITAKDLTICYGQEATFKSDVVNLLDNEVITYDCDYLNVGTYTIKPIFVNDNYDLTINNGTLTVVKADLKVSINVPSSSITYGDELPMYSISKYEGFVYNETESILNGSFTYHCDYSDTKKVGIYTIAFSGLSADNYNIVYQEVTCTVNKAVLTFTINELSPITYLDPEPTYTYTVTGYVNGDDSSAFSGVNIVSNYKQNDNASTIGYAYYVDVSNAVSDNYSFITNGTKYLIVNKYTPKDVTCSAINGIVYSPSATLATYEDLLPQYFSWVSPNTTPVCAISSYDAIYNPDSTNYNDVIVSVPMKIAKATSTISYSSLETNYTGSEIEYIYLINATTNNTDNSVVDYELTLSLMQDGGLYPIKLTIFETANYTECIVNIIFKVKSALIGSTYYTVEDALSVGGDIIVLGDSFVSSGTYELKSGSSLNLYYDDSNSLLNSHPDSTSNYFADYEEATYLKKSLTLNTGTILNVYGTMNIGGITASPSVNLNGHTSGDYTQINIESGSTINVKSGGQINCYGYIKGDGNTIYEDGAIAYYPFAIRDFKGGTHSYAIYKKASAAPFEQFELANNQTYQTINYGAIINAYCVLYASSEFHSTTATFIGPSSGLFILTSGTIDLHVVPQSKNKNAVTTSYFTFNGNVSLGSLNVKITVSIISVDVDTASVLCPISYLMNITQNTGTFTIANKMQLLTGSVFTINSGAEMIVNKNLMIRSTAFGDPFTESYWYPNTYGPAQLINNGNITINSVSIGGRIYSTQEGSSITTGSFTHGVSTNMCKGKNTLGIVSVDGSIYTITEEKLLLVNSDASESEASQSTTYTYNGSIWS